MSFRILTLKNSKETPLNWNLVNENNETLVSFRGSKFKALELANAWISSFHYFNITLKLEEASYD